MEHKPILILGISFIGLLYGNYIFYSYLARPEPLIQKQVIGNAKADIYIERDGIKYFSHVDGKEISDLVQE